MKHLSTIIISSCCSALSALAQAPVDTLHAVEELQEVVVRQPRGVRKLQGATNTTVMGVAELHRAACCNLGESFTTNPSVDVSYTDAATGARRIRLLGLQGAYVQMLSENIPALRGVASPFGLSYIPGPWMQSIQVSKGASSVKNGYESLTGQINVEMKKPQLDPSLAINGYYDSMNKAELNADGNLHFGRLWSGGLLLHAENSFTAHDGDGDGFMDSPKIRQFSAMNRWAYMGTDYKFQASVKFLDERRTSGQHEHQAAPGTELYKVGINTRRWEFFAKNAYMFDQEAGSNVALMLSGTSHSQDATYGLKINNIDQHEAYASLMYETTWGPLHALSAGLSFNYDHLSHQLRLTPDAAATPTAFAEREAVSGAYAQYTFNANDRLIAMAGLRYDYSNEYGSLVTPRVHLRWIPREGLSAHASAGRGARSPHPLAEYGYLLASSRRFEVLGRLRREEGWNAGGGVEYSFSPGGRKLTLGAEYYYTDFTRCLTLDLDSDPHAALLDPYGRSRSHAVQAELTAEPTSDLSLSAAWRYTAVHQRSEGVWRSAPLTSRWKTLISVAYSPRMGLWQFDVTCAVNGPGRMPAPYVTAGGAQSWKPRYKAFPTLNAQATRNFRHWAVYIGGENLTGYRQKNAIVGASDPWGPDFDATLIHGPLHGAMVYAGFRYNITKFL